VVKKLPELFKGNISAINNKIKGSIKLPFINFSWRKNLLKKDSKIITKNTNDKIRKPKRPKSANISK
tara:strand:- start:35 stop:235 length:201 start_codon:yes stop_codon:yes gene_type:complete